MLLSMIMVEDVSIFDDDEIKAQAQLHAILLSMIMAEDPSIFTIDIGWDCADETEQERREVRPNHWRYYGMAIRSKKIFIFIAEVA